MEKIVVYGGRELHGTVEVGGSKNAALPLLFAGILTGDTCVFSSLPRVSDVLQTLEILRFLGARIRFVKNGDVSVDYSDMRPLLPPMSLTCAIRGSVYLLGAMLGRFGKAELGGSGGCDFGKRPIDQHILGFSALGAKESYTSNVLMLAAPKGLLGTVITLKMPSVGATVNLMMAATSATGTTVIQNAAAEPHVAALAAFLRQTGATVEGVGTDTVTVVGGKPLHGCRTKVIPDMIEAGTYLSACMATGGTVTVHGALPSHLGAVLDTLSNMGASLETGDTFVTITAPEKYRCVNIETGPFPAFPTDLHPQFATLFTLGHRATGIGSVAERVWQSRFRYVEELRKMGATVSVNEEIAHFTPSALKAMPLVSPDLRGGAALLIAALATKGRTEIANACTIGRGYEHLEDKFRTLGAEISVDF